MNIKEAVEKAFILRMTNTNEDDDFIIITYTDVLLFIIFKLQIIKDSDELIIDQINDKKKEILDVFSNELFIPEIKKITNEKVYFPILENLLLFSSYCFEIISEWTEYIVDNKELSDEKLTKQFYLIVKKEQENIS